MGAGGCCYFNQTLTVVPPSELNSGWGLGGRLLAIGGIG